MTDGNQTLTRSKDDLRVLAPWAYYLFAAVLVTTWVLFVTVVGLDPKAPRLPIRCLLGLLCGAVLACYAVLIGYINQDAGRRNMSRLLWTLIAIFVPNGLGIVLYFVLRKPRTAHCPQCDAEVEPGFSFCPRCSNKLSPNCPQCRRAVGANDVYCPYCGTPVRTPAAPQV
jgi:Double zinc ribbon